MKHILKLCKTLWHHKSGVDILTKFLYVNLDIWHCSELATGHALVAIWGLSLFFVNFQKKNKNLLVELTLSSSRIGHSYSSS